MPWSNNQGGGGWQGGGGQGPWGGRPGGSQQPPDLEELLQKTQERFKKWLPSGGGPGGGDGGGAGGGGPFQNKKVLGVILLAVAALWLASGIYRVNTDEQGVELVFGRLSDVTPTAAGLSYNFPAPIGSVIKANVTTQNLVEVGFRSGGQARGGTRPGQYNEESLMLTGDENIVDINFVVLWKVNNAADFLFNIRNPEETIKAAAESVMREIVGSTPIAEVTTEGRRAVETEARASIQALLDEYGAGISVNEVQLQKADPPAEVIEAFRDVQRAQADRERLRNEAEAYANDIVPRARGDAERVLQEAEAFRQEAVAQAEGEAQRFTQVFREYARAQDVTVKRLYLETMQDVLGGMDKTIIDSAAQGGGVVPYLPLPEVQRRRGGETPASAGAGETQP